MWRRRIFFGFNLPKVYDSKKSRIRRRIVRKNLNLKASLGLGCELGKQKIRKKRKMAGKNGVSDRNFDIDRFSELPESIIHHIFSFLRCTKDVARTTILSKNWKSMFDSYQSFEFDQRWFRMSEGGGKSDLIEAPDLQKKKFEEYVEKSLATRVDCLKCIDKFRLCANNVDIPLMECISRWIHAAMAKNVRELDVQVDSWKEFPLSVDLTQSNSITFLKLGGNSLSGLAAMKMRNLRGISIKNAKFLDVNVMKKLEENCPLLEDVRLVGCPMLLHLKISSLVKLRRVEVQDCLRVKRIEIAASNLETFWYHAKENQKCKIDLKCKENLRNLTLKSKVMNVSAFEDCISMCPLLEKLVLHKCHGIGKLTICSLTLKSLVLIQCARLHQVDIDAPNLYSFQYDGRAMSFPFICALRLFEAKFSFNPQQWRSNLKFENFFKNFDRYKGFKLVAYTKQNMKICEEPREVDLYQRNSLYIELSASLSKAVKTVDNWLRERHGKSLVLVSSDSELIKLVNTLIINREDNPSCCRFYSNKCWRHYIEDVKVSNKTSFDFTWRPRKERVEFYEDQDLIAIQL